MMILEAIYNGDFYPSETVVPKSEKYRNALRACEKIMDQLAQRLSWISPPSLSARRASATSRVGFSAGLLVQQEAVEQIKTRSYDE